MLSRRYVIAQKEFTIQSDVFEDVTLDVNPQQVHEWQAQLAQWQRDKTLPNPLLYSQPRRFINSATTLNSDA